MDLPVSQPWSCRLQSYTLHSSSLTSNYLLISMTFERFYSIIRPHKAALFNTVKKAKIIILCVFIGCFINSIPFLFLGANIGTKCIPIKNASDKLLHELYYWFQEILIFIFPFISLLTMNSVIINTLKNRSKQNILESADQVQSEGQNSKFRQVEKQIVFMVLLIAFVFLFLNIPARSMVFYLSFSRGDTAFYYAGLHLFHQIGEKAYFTNNGVNFYLYVISGHKFRTDLKKLFVIKK